MPFRILLVSLIAAIIFTKTGNAGVWLEYNGEKCTLSSFIQSSAGETDLFFISNAERLKRKKKITEKDHKLAIAYEVAAVRAGYSELISWLWRKFNEKDLKMFVDGDDSLLDEIYYTLLKA